MSTVFFLFVNNVNSVNSVNIVNSYSAVLPPSPMVFFVLELLSIVINATRETFPALSSKCLDLFVLQRGLMKNQACKILCCYDSAPSSKAYDC